MLCVIFSFQEKVVLNKLKFRLNVPTPYVFMMRFLKAAQSDKRVYSNISLLKISGSRF